MSAAGCRSLEVAGRSCRERPQWRLMGVVKEDRKWFGVREKDAEEERFRWRHTIGLWPLTHLGKKEFRFIFVL